MTDLMRKIDALAKSHHAKRVKVVRVKLGALSHFTPEHFQEHFDHASAGSIAEGAKLDMEMSTDMSAPFAQDVLLDAIEVEERG